MTVKKSIQYLGKKKAAPTLLETREQDQGRRLGRRSEGVSVGFQQGNGYSPPPRAWT